MRPKTVLVSLIALAALSAVLSLSSTTTLAQSGGGYDLTWGNVGGGGGQSTGGGFSLSGTIGQPGTGVLSGGGYTLNGGFWGSTPADHRAFLPLVSR